jgi:hypothetical protein
MFLAQLEIALMFDNARRAVLSLALICLAPSCLAQHMATEGQFTVGATGAARYTIPIHVPAGTAGMTPNLALSYDSQRGSRGLLGVGWSLTGFSTIRPCPQTMAQDGKRGTVSYTYSDRYCIDGERLVAVKGVYGADGAEYRTERDTFARIVSHGKANLKWKQVGGVWQYVAGEPLSFTVESKDGRTMTYGGTVDSRIMAASGTSTSYNLIKGWALNRMQDRMGNFLKISYSNMSYMNDAQGTKNDDGVFYPVRIDYTGNTSAVIPVDPNDPSAGSTGLIPTNSIVFEYRGRDFSPAFSYENGFPINVDRILSGIRVVGDPSTNIVYRHYALDYFFPTSPLTENPRIVAITECGNGTQVAECLSPLSFGWQAGPVVTDAFSPTPSDSAFPGTRTDYRHYFVDVNGDGKQRWIQISAGTDEAWIGEAKSDGSFTADQWHRIATSIGAGDNYEHYFADVDGDGKVDWIRVSRTTNEAWIALGQGNGQFDFWTRYTQTVGSANSYAHYFVDVDGDGRADWVEVSRTIDDAAVALATGGGNFQFWTNRITQNISLTKYEHYFADVNGDGMADWIRVARNADTGTLQQATGDGNFSAPMTFGLTREGAAKHYFADLNGDGKADLFQYILATANTPASWGATLSNGRDPYSGYTPSWTFPPLNGTIYDLAFTDFDGDGMTDIMLPPGPGQNGVVFRSSAVWFGGIGGSPVPDGLMSRGAIPLSLSNTTQYQNYYADLNGDGKSDWIQVDPSTNRAKVSMSIARNIDRIVSISNDVGSPISITYKALNDASVYTPDSDAVYPLRDVKAMQLSSLDAYRSNLQASRYIVSSASIPNGSGGDLITNYSYGGLKRDLAGRGELGFRWIQASDVSTGIVTRTDYRLDWPYSGLPTSSKKILQGAGNNGLLAQASYTYGCNDFISVGGCTVAPGKRYFPFTTQSVSSSWDLNGAVLPVTTTSYQFDAFGNPTQVVTSTSDDHSSTTTTAYSNDTTKWWIGMPTRTSVVNTAP